MAVTQTFRMSTYNLHLSSIIAKISAQKAFGDVPDGP